MNRLDPLVIENLNNYKDQSNEAINSELIFDTSSSNLSSGNSNLLPVVTVYLQEENKHRAKNVAGLICLWGIRATYGMIKRQHIN